MTYAIWKTVLFLALLVFAFIQCRKISEAVALSVAEGDCTIEKKNRIDSILIKCCIAFTLAISIGIYTTLSY